METKRVTRKDVAAHAGVSVAVVSYVVNDGPRPVAAATKARVEKAIEELGYFPNELARSLSRKQTSTIGLLIPSLVNPYYGEVAETLTEVCWEKGYQLMLGGTSRNQKQEIELAKMLRANQVDGIIVIPSQSPNKVLEPLQQAHIPTVVLEHDLFDVHCVALDESLGARLAMEHLLSLGHRRIGMLKLKPTSALSNQRYEIYRETLESAEIPLDPTIVVECSMHQNDGFVAMQKLLRLPEPPTAVFSHNDVLAMGAMRAIYTAGLAVPDDISIVGYDNITSSEFCNPPLTTINVPIAEMGKLAGELLIRLIEDKDVPPPETTILPVELVIRSSTRRLNRTSD